MPHAGIPKIGKLIKVFLTGTVLLVVVKGDDRETIDSEELVSVTIEGGNQGRGFGRIIVRLRDGKLW